MPGFIASPCRYDGAAPHLSGNDGVNCALPRRHAGAAPRLVGRDGVDCAFFIGTLAARCLVATTASTAPDSSVMPRMRRRTVRPQTRRCTSWASEEEVEALGRAGGGGRVGTCGGGWGRVGPCGRGGGRVGPWRRRRMYWARKEE